MLRRALRRLSESGCADCHTPCATGAIAAELGPDANTRVRHIHDGIRNKEKIDKMYADGVPFFSMFSGQGISEKIRNRILHVSVLPICSTAEFIEVSCVDCGMKKTVESPNDLLDPTRNFHGRAAVAICPSCIIEVTKSVFL